MKGKDMENSDKAKIIVGLLKDKLRQGISDYINARAEQAKAQVGSEFWVEQDGDMMGFSRNPYNTELAAKKVERTLKEKRARQEVLDYAIDVFLNKI
jgi:hypothetical protein